MEDAWMSAVMAGRTAEEMARWRSIGHAGAALVILGRIGGIDEETLNKLIEAGRVDAILGKFDRP
jgi:hypothetical protein